MLALSNVTQMYVCMFQKVLIGLCELKVKNKGKSVYIYLDIMKSATVN